MAHNELSQKFDLNSAFILKTVQNGIIASATTVTGTPAISMAKSHFIAFVCIPIDASLAGAITAWIYQATSTAGTPKAVSGKSTTWSAGTGDIGIKVLECDASELDVANGYDHATLKVKTAGADSFAVAIIRGPNRYDPSAYI